MFSFTMLQEYIASRLGVELGMYYHNAGSLHVYVDRDQELVARLRNTDSLQMEIMPSIEYAQLWAFYKALKQPTRDLLLSLSSIKLLPYWKDLALAVHAFKVRKEAADFAFIFNKIGGAALQQILKNYASG